MGEKTKIFAISDIHGHYTAMKDALLKAGFEKENPNHLLVCCGDYFDRGTENMQVLKYLDCIENKVLLRGNHEEMLLEIFETGKLKPHNFLNGTEETIKEFFGKYSIDEFGEIDFSGKTGIFNRAWDFMSATANYYETKNYVFVHGWFPVSKTASGMKPQENWRTADENAWHEARWTKWSDMIDVCTLIDGKTVVCGHYPTIFANMSYGKEGEERADIFYDNGVIAIDGGTYTTGRVNVLVVEDELI